MAPLDCFLSLLVSGRAGLTREQYVRRLGPCWLFSGISFFYAVCKHRTLFELTVCGLFSS